MPHLFSLVEVCQVVLSNITAPDQAAAILKAILQAQSWEAVMTVVEMDNATD
jgi:hypothetical protein